MSSAVFLTNSHSTENEEKEKTLVEELVEILPYDSPSTLDLLLRVLSALPEEFGKRQGVRRTRLREGLVESWCKTTWILQQVFSTCDRPSSEGSNSTLYLLGIECAFSWLKMGQLPLETTGRIFPHLLEAASCYAPNRTVSNEESHRGWEIVQECLILVVTHAELQKRPQLLWEWSRGLVCTARQNGGRHFCEILTALGEAHSRAFLLALIEEHAEEQKWTSEGLIELLLQCSEQEGRYPIDEKSSCIPFGFWYALQDDLTTLDPPFESRASFALRPIYGRLAQALLRKAALPKSSRESGDSQERELLRCYRQDAADTLTYCYNVLGQDLLLLLGQRLSQLNDDSQNWTDVESTLHAFSALCESIRTQENHYVAALMDLVLSHIPYGEYPREVLSCACSAMGSYAEWIGAHPDPWLERALQLVTLGLTQGPFTAPAASMALKDIARECGPYLAPLAPSILNTIGRTLQTVTPGGGEGLRLMYAAGKLLNSLPSTEEQLRHLDATLGPCVMRLRELLQHPALSASASVINQLMMAAMLFSTLDGSIGKTVLDGLLPLFEQIVSHPEWGRDDATLNAMHTCAQRSLASLLHPETDARPLLSMLSTSYRIRPHPAALNLLRQLVILFGRDPENVVGPIFAELSGLTLGGVAACRSVGGNMSDLSELLEAYLCLLAQVCKKSARILSQVPDQIPEMLHCGIDCLSLPETGTARAAGSFLTHAIMHSPHLQTYINPIGQELVCVILQCVGGKVPRNSLEPHAEVLLALNKTCLEWTAQWLRRALAEGIAVTDAQKETFTRNILRERINKQQLSETLKDFSLLCRQPMIGL
ncbi:importin-13 isoform X2 [Orussus abietinus]|uniref:importin-13 isoform X2 n=1 Tax=Orussus abietinus TaxID=222816 RepID=UPI00062533AF|nr:importin-13 isoform X2 [Orussus abietinus]